MGLLLPSLRNPYRPVCQVIRVRASENRAIKTASVYPLVTRINRNHYDEPGGKGNFTPNRKSRSTRRPNIVSAVVIS